VVLEVVLEVVLGVLLVTGAFDVGRRAPETP
jgi:hypothetical protein